MTLSKQCRAGVQSVTKIKVTSCLRLAIDAPNVLEELDDGRCAPINAHRFDNLPSQSLEIDLYVIISTVNCHSRFSIEEGRTFVIEVKDPGDSLFASASIEG